MSITAAALIICSSYYVYDGDTLWCGREKIRIANIDAPELPGSPKCKGRRASYAWCDYKLGYASRDALRGFMKTGRVEFQRTGTDPYGRALGRLLVDGRDAGQYLISINLARRWR
jgi:micrococcal nuclease